MKLADAIAEAKAHATQARRNEKEAHGHAHQNLERGQFDAAAQFRVTEARYWGQADAWERAAKLMEEVTP